MPKNKLSDIQLVLLTSACQREDGSLLPAPDSLGDQATRVRRAIMSLIRAGLVIELDGVKAARVWRTEGDTIIGAIVSDAGRAAIDPPEGAKGPNVIEPTDAVGAPPASPRRASKQAQVIELLKCEGGATLTAIVQATGWLPHTSRAALTGLRKKGHAIVTGKVDGTTYYTISAVA